MHVTHVGLVPTHAVHVFHLTQTYFYQIICKSTSSNSLFNNYY